MKIEEALQEGQSLENTPLRNVYYALDEQGNYRQVLSAGCMAKHDALSLTWECISKEAETIRQEVLAGKKSPLAYHIKMRLLDIPMLAAYTGLPKKTIKKHLEAKAFSQIDASILKKYADAMHITEEELKSV
ncbi:MAG: hypothetical protein LBG31_02090 [Prevotellaceae bacterium]|jgi:hypothetical protein|nr:hypothetical protein [Prevotellaceae bacterium]